MARPVNSTFKNILPVLEEQHVAAYNWGFVSGKTQTIFPWDSWKKQYTAEPPVWFHDILHTDGTPYNPEETKLIRQVNDKGRASRVAGVPVMDMMDHAVVHEIIPRQTAGE
jgi:hypothetical protein